MTCRAAKGRCYLIKPVELIAYLHAAIRSIRSGSHSNPPTTTTKTHLTIRVFRDSFAVAKQPLISSTPAAAAAIAPTSPAKDIVQTSQLKSTAVEFLPSARLTASAAAAKSVASAPTAAPAVAVAAVQPPAAVAAAPAPVEAVAEVQPVAAAAAAVEPVADAELIAKMAALDVAAAAAAAEATATATPAAAAVAVTPIAEVAPVAPVAPAAVAAKPTDETDRAAVAVVDSARDALINNNNNEKLAPVTVAPAAAPAAKATPVDNNNAEAATPAADEAEKVGFGCTLHAGGATSVEQCSAIKNSEILRT